MTFKEEQSYVCDFGFFDDPGSKTKYHNILTNTLRNYWILGDVNDKATRLGQL